MVPRSDAVNVRCIAPRKANAVAIPHMLGKELLGKTRGCRLAVCRHEPVCIVCAGCQSLRCRCPSHLQVRSATYQVDEGGGIVGASEGILIEASRECLLMVSDRVQLATDIEDLAAV